MTKELVIWSTIGVYIVFMLVIGILNSRSTKNISNFTVGGRNAGAWVSALSYGTAYFSAVMFIGYAGSTGWSYGIWGVLVGVGNAVFGALLAWIVLARRTREVTQRLNIKSMPQFFEKRFESQGMKRFAVAVIFIFLLPYSASVYKGLTSVC
ncbi:MAG TPA: sodium:solute symporter family protein, partial [Candidatus Avimonas sp.]|nr:sodium:solute symporter family protein [Candidatus Avimonas sp.]